jgi:hypothetical protein
MREPVADSAALDWGTAKGDLGKGKLSSVLGGTALDCDLCDAIGGFSSLGRRGWRQFVTDGRIANNSHLQ